MTLTDAALRDVGIGWRFVVDATWGFP
jgi:hypothetical protein